MHTAKSHLWHTITVTAAVVGVCAPADAWADGASVPGTCEAPQLLGRIVEVRFGEGDAPIDLPLHPEIVTTVRIDSRTTRALSSYIQGTIVSATERGLTLEVGKTGAAQRMGTQGILTAETAAGPVPFAVRAVAEPEQAVALALVRHRTPADAGKSAVTVLGSVCSLEREIDSITSTLTDELREREIERDRAVGEAEAKTFMTHVDDRTFSVVDLHSQGCSGDEIVLCPRLYTRSDSLAVLLVDALNRTNRTVPIQHAQVVDKYSDGDHTLLFGITDDHQRPTTLIEPGERVKVAVLLRDPDRIGSSLRLVLSGASPVLPAAEWVTIPSPIKQAEQEFERRRREREAKRVSLHVTGSYGAILFPSGVDGSDDTAAASLKGIGVRFTKGYTPALAFEAEIGGATSGEATFDGVTVEGMTGDLARSVRLARVTVGGVLRFGDTVVPNVRLGVGLQLSDEDATLVTGSGSVEGPGAGFEFAGSIYGGVGVDVKIGSNLLAGVCLSFTQSDQRILDLGLSVAYRWDSPE